MKKFFLIALFFLLTAFAVNARSAGTDAMSTTTDPSEAFIEGSVVVKGDGAAPFVQGESLSPARKKIMALRAAKIAALREAAEIINGVTVSGSTVIRDAATESDTVRASVEGVITGAQVVKEDYDPVTGNARVYVSIPMTGPKGLYSGVIPRVSSVLPDDEYPPFSPVAPGPGGYDGLIVDVSAQYFRPALINRVITENGEAVYDPARLRQSVLSEKGAAEYTNSMDRARALLRERGSKNPLVVVARDVERSTDVVVGAKDASAIFASNQASSFLEGAKVVFVLR